MREHDWQLSCPRPPLRPPQPVPREPVKAMVVELELKLFHIDATVAVHVPVLVNLMEF